MNRHAQMLKIIGGLLSVAFGNVLIMQMMKGIGLGSRLVSVFKYLTKGIWVFSKALWASPLTWYIAALETSVIFSQTRGMILRKRLSL